MGDADQITTTSISADANTGFVLRKRGMRVADDNIERCAVEFRI
jgi:hypothetical protein